MEVPEQVGRQVGRGLGMVVSAVAPGWICRGGETAAAWSLVEPPVRRALVEERLTGATRATPVIPDRSPDARHPLGAVALLVAPDLAAPGVA